MISHLVLHKKKNNLYEQQREGEFKKLGKESLNSNGQQFYKY